ncbi:MAG: hypothetical protein QXS20_09025 [Candidatus Thorarchaeota archaeon]
METGNERDNLSGNASRIGPTSNRVGSQLRSSAEKQVRDYTTRLEALSGAYDAAISRLMISHDQMTDVEFVRRFFGKTRLTFAGIDGTLYKHRLFDMMIFYAGAFAVTGVAMVDESGSISIRYREPYSSGRGVTSVLPVYVNEVPFLDQSLLPRDENGPLEVAVGRGDAYVADNSALAEYMMCLAEFYLAYRLVSDKDHVDILLLDRICSAEQASSYAETSEHRIDLDTECALIGHEVKGRPFTKTEWVYFRRIFGLRELNTPPPRAEYLLPRIVAELLHSRSMTRQELSDTLRLTGDRGQSRLDAALEKGMKRSLSEDPIIVRRGNVFEIDPKYRDVVERVELLVRDLCERIFSEDPSVDCQQRFRIGGRWMTTNDIAFLSYCCLQLMTMYCWRNRILLVGVAKDSSARDMKRQLIPTLCHTGHMKTDIPKSVEQAPDTDRMVLQWISLQERHRLVPPWATIEYDTAFKTIVPDLSNRPGLVSGARRNQIGLNRTFVKAYFQLSAAASDSRLRSNVLLYDRLAYAGYDDRPENTVVLRHDYDGHEDDPEQVEAVLYLNAPSPIQDFIIALFSRMTMRSIPELFGHIRPLYTADKVAKFYQKHFRSMVRSVSSWICNRPDLREFIFYVSSFRERRSGFERTRTGV